jgi:hypothetical protein
MHTVPEKTKLLEEYLGVRIACPQKYYKLFDALSLENWRDMKLYILANKIDSIIFKKKAKTSRLHLYFKKDLEIIQEVFVAFIYDKNFYAQIELEKKNKDLAAYYISDKGSNFCYINIKTQNNFGDLIISLISLN